MVFTTGKGRGRGFVSVEGLGWRVEDLGWRFRVGGGGWGVEKNYNPPHSTLVTPHYFVLFFC